MATPDSGNPTNLDALPAKQISNGGGFVGILQPDEQVTRVANPTDLATALTAIIALRDAMVTLGLMKAA